MTFLLCDLCVLLRPVHYWLRLAGVGYCAPDALRSQWAGDAPAGLGVRARQRRFSTGSQCYVTTELRWKYDNIID